MRRVAKKFFVVAAIAAIGLTACGGSKSESSDSASSDTATVSNGSNADSGSLAAFCNAARDNQGGADIAADDDPAKIAEKLSANADALAGVAAKAPSAVKADAQVVADAAKQMAGAIAADPTLDKFNTLIADFAASDANAASQRVQTWVNDNCEAGQS